MRPFRTVAALIAFALCAFTASADDQPPPKSIIFMIGDGMGVSQITLTRAVTVGPEGSLTLDSFPVTGLVKTHSANYIVTDSAAAVTALACGIKTNNQSIGVDPAGVSVTSIADLARAAGKATGVVTTTNVTHATPAGFYAHVNERSKEVMIAEQLVARGDVEVAMGGGQKNFSDDLLNQLRGKKYDVAMNREEMLSSKGDRLVGIFTPQHMSFDRERDPVVEPALAEMTAKAIEVLSRNPKGFFLMVEGGKIDFGGHMHDAATVVNETAAFDAAVAVAQKWAKAHGDTLVVVTADHATGGLAISEAANLTRLKEIKVSGETLAKLIKDQGMSIGETVKGATGVELTPEEMAQVQAAVDKEKHGRLYGVQTTVATIVSEHLGVTWMPLEFHFEVSKNTHGHDGGMVPVYADGPGAGAFGGTMNNVEIPARMARALGLDPALLGKPVGK